jgi:hypothetical protein
MTKRKRILPFGWAPAHWGMTGKLRDVAQAEYELEGEELERRKLEINIGDRSDEDIKIEGVKLDLKFGKIDKIEHEKQIATIINEPWVIIKTLETDLDNPRYGGVELDWNDAFVSNLEKHGYGPNPEQDDTVNEWFNDLCRNIALEAFDGVGDLQDRIDNEQNSRTGMHEDVITIRPDKRKKGD